MFTDPYSPVQTDYQRQQLNVLRRHQGLSPIPPGRRYVDFIEGMWSLTFRILASVILFFAIGLALHEPDDPVTYESWVPTWWQVVFWLASPVVLFLVLSVRREMRLEAEYQRTLRRWEQAGRP